MKKVGLKVLLLSAAFVGAVLVASYPRLQAASLERDKEAALAEARLARSQRHVQAAETAYRRVLSIDPTDKEALLGLTDLAMDKSQLAEAKELLQSYYHAWPDNAAEFPVMRYPWTQGGDLAGLRQLLDMYSRALPGLKDRRLAYEAEAGACLFMVSSRRGLLDAPTVQDLLRKAHQALDRAAPGGRGSAMASYMRGELSLVEGQDGPALGYFEDARRGPLPTWEAILDHVACAILLSHGKDPARARAETEQAQSAYDAWPDVHFGLIKPIDEYLGMTRQAYLHERSDWKRILDAAHRRYDALESQGIRADMRELMIRDALPAYLLAPSKARGDNLLKLAHSFDQGCGLQDLIMRHFKAMIHLQRGERQEVLRLFPSDTLAR